MDKDVPQLLGQTSTIAPQVDEEAVGILAIRDELTSLSDFPGLVDEEVFNDSPPTVDGLRMALAQAESIRQHGSFAQLGVMLPGLLAEARAAVRELSGDDQLIAHGLRSEVIQIASTMLTALGKPDIGYT
ncbi:hypothetical protein F4560_005140 [Saccharothrix ecbatanensis]|uniref:Uncharacterized protein n=1 Tax=Saccharothrix ecbatanensis TaxID=1105145 RepID=A0A7W9HN79_9PSEU|nr:hypothetical protein [Saccharothrix ecbatanensis]MBB5805372.1 hypothetical protein [Saccharothrix ecbatanensis]